MSDNLVKRICDAWIKDGLANECFWEGWPQCPTPDDSLTPKMVLDRIEALQAALAQAEAERDAAYERAAGVVARWNNSTRDGDTEFIAAAIRQLKGQHHD
jgi:hypothetical protein